MQNTPDCSTGVPLPTCLLVLLSVALEGGIGGRCLLEAGGGYGLKLHLGQLVWDL